ncbi:MAG: hypothetical protein IJZ03_02085 [Clostridia bacterium]|nr:hypothetical protein [Clostridia bacterium]
MGEQADAPHDHSFGEWKYDTDSHWKECRCGQKDSNASHSFGDWIVTEEATTTAEGSRYRTCSVCSYKQTETIPMVSHTHTFGGWKSNATSHWKECNCGQKDSNASHSFGDWIVTEEASTSAEGSRYRTCVECGYQETATIPMVTPHNHTFDGWKSNATSHWKECNCGQKDSNASHSFGDWIVTEEASTSAEGSRYRTCSVCSYKQTETIPMVSHTHTFGDWKSNATSHWKECNCGQKDSNASHSFGDWIVTKEATTSAEGSRYRACSVCSYKQTETIPMVSHTHTFGDWKSNATSHWKECRCGQKDNNASHSFGDWIVTKEASTSAEGSRYRTCSVCSYKQTETIPMVPHTHTFSRTSAGLKKGKCDICGKTMPVYNLGSEIYDRPGENLWLVVNENGSYDWYYEADVNATVEDYCRAEFANNYSSYRYPVMDLQVFDGVANHRYVLIFYIENGELKHIIPSDPSWNKVIPDNVVDPKEIFCSDGELRSTYEATVWSGYVIDKGTTTLGGKTEEYTVTLKMHTPRSKSFWETNRSGPTFYTYYTTSYSAPFQKLENNSSALQNTVKYNANGDYYTVSAYTEKYYQAPDVYDLYYYQNSGLLSTITSGYSPKYYLYSDMTCEKINSTSAPLSKEIYQGLPYGLEFTLMSDNPNEVVTYKFVVDHPEFRNVTEIYKTVYTKHELYLVKSGSSGGYVLTDVKPS